MVQGQSQEMAEAGFEPEALGSQAALSSAAHSSIRSARDPAAGLRALQPQHPEGVVGTKPRSAARGARVGARAGARAPAKMFPLGVIDRLECRETKLFMR